MNPCDKPLAAHGLTSYRYAGSYGWIMLGARDHAEALKEAARSTRATIYRSNLQVWDSTRYVNAF